MSNEMLDKLTNEILTYSGDEGDFDFDDEFEAKAARIDLSGCNYGDKLIITWKLSEPELDDDGEMLDDGTFEDVGYLTTIPGVLDEDTPEFSAVIHVPQPENPGGMGNVEGEWISVFDAINNPLIVSIKPFRREGETLETFKYAFKILTSNGYNTEFTDQLSDAIKAYETGG